MKRVACAPDTSIRNGVYSMQTVGSTNQRAAHFSDGRFTLVVRQAGSRDPVRRSVAETERETAIHRLRVTRGTRRDGGVRKDVEPKGIPRNQPRWGLSRFVRAGDPENRSLIQAGQNPYRLAPHQSSKVPVKATDRRGISPAAFTSGTEARGSVCSAPSLQSMSLLLISAPKRSR